MDAAFKVVVTMPDVFLGGEKDNERQTLPKHAEDFFDIRFFFIVLTMLAVMLLFGGFGA